MNPSKAWQKIFELRLVFSFGYGNPSSFVSWILLTSLGLFFRFEVNRETLTSRLSGWFWYNILPELLIWLNKAFKFDFRVPTKANFYLQLGLAVALCLEFNPKFSMTAYVECEKRQQENHLTFKPHILKLCMQQGYPELCRAPSRFVNTNLSFIDLVSFS